MDMNTASLVLLSSDMAHIITHRKLKYIVVELNALIMNLFYYIIVC